MLKSAANVVSVAEADRAAARPSRADNAFYVLVVGEPDAPNRVDDLGDEHRAFPASASEPGNPRLLLMQHFYSGRSRSFPSAASAALRSRVTSRSPLRAAATIRLAMTSCTTAGCPVSCSSLHAASKASPMMRVVASSNTPLGTNGRIDPTLPPTRAQHYQGAYSQIQFCKRGSPNVRFAP